jgi:hypothetical protein
MNGNKRCKYRGTKMGGAAEKLKKYRDAGIGGTKRGENNLSQASKEGKGYQFIASVF